MPNWAASSIHATGDAAEARRFVKEFMKAFEDGRIGDEGASKLAGVYETSPDGMAGYPRACWSATRGKKIGDEVVLVDEAVSFGSKWRCCFTRDELVRMSRAHPSLTLTLDTAEIGMGIEERAIASDGAYEVKSKKEMRPIVEEEGFKALMEMSG